MALLTSVSKRKPHLVDGWRRAWWAPVAGVELAQEVLGAFPAAGECGG